MTERDKTLKHIPARMCAACGKRLPKNELTRFVFSPERVPVEDLAKRLPGRGHYVCASGGCLEKWLKRSAKKFGKKADGCLRNK